MEEVVKEDHHEGVISSLEPAGRKDKGIPMQK